MSETMTREQIETEICSLKQLLKNTDYQATKYSEGWIPAEEYEPIKQQRKSWRDAINDYEGQIAAMDDVAEG